MHLEAFISSIEIARHRRMFDIAKNIALDGPGVGGRDGKTFRLGAVLVNGPIGIISKYNSYKTHPELIKFTIYPYLHAEQAVILFHGLDNCAGLSLFTLRITRQNHIALAKPCKVCLELIRLAQIKHVYYTTENGYDSKSHL